MPDLIDLDAPANIPTVIWGVRIQNAEQHKAYAMGLASILAGMNNLYGETQYPYTHVRTCHNLERFRVTNFLSRFTLMTGESHSALFENALLETDVFGWAFTDGYGEDGLPLLGRYNYGGSHPQVMIDFTLIEVDQVDSNKATAWSRARCRIVGLDASSINPQDHVTAFVVNFMRALLGHLVPIIGAEWVDVTETKGDTTGMSARDALFVRDEYAYAPHKITIGG